MNQNRRKWCRKEVELKAVPTQRRLALGEVLVDVKADLREMMISGGLKVMSALFEEDLARLCGARYTRKGDESHLASRWGSERGVVVLGGRKVKVDRPRARRDGGEVALPSYAHLLDEDPLSDRAFEQMLIGVSTRKYQRSLEPLSSEMEEVATSKSAVSRRFVMKTEAQLEAALSKPLDKLRWAALMVDGIEFAEHVIVVVLGIDDTGKKHVLGLREGSTENGSLCRELLSGIVARGLPADRSILVVIDGGKGLRKAINEVFGGYAIVQRCQVHKKRNVLDHLPEEDRPQVGAVLTQAYAAESYTTALKQLENQVRMLSKSHPGAAESLREGLKETLTVKRFGITGPLARTLSTTNPIESMNEILRLVSRRVKRWGSGKMALRWAAAGAFEAAKGFRRLRGCKEMPKLVAALKAHDEQMKTIDSVRKVG